MEKNPTKNGKWMFLIVVIVGFATLIGLSMNLLNKEVTAEYYDNTSVITRVNVTNQGPVVHSVLLHDSDSNTNIILEQGLTHTVICNSTVNDTNGWGDVANVNATIYKFDEYNIESDDDNNNHYTNSSCAQTSTSGLLEARYMCKFHVWYYAYNGTWTCNVSAQDNSDVMNFTSDNALVDPLYALNLSVEEIDFGELAPAEVSTDEEINVTNWGNMDIDISVKGYGVVEGDTYSMACQVGNIPVANEKFSVESGTAYASMTSLGSNFAAISGLTVPFRVDDSDSDYLNSTNATFWKISPSKGTKGICNGTIVFSAVD